MPLDPSDHVAGHRTVPGSPQRRDGADGAIRLELPTRAPFAGAVLHRFLAVHAVAGTEAAAADGRFACTLRLPHGAAVAELTLTDTATARVWLTDPRDLDGVRARLRRLCDLDADPVAVDDVLRREPVLAPLVEATPGLRLHGTCDPTELAVRALLGQQISIAAASRVTEHLIRTYGDPLPPDLARTAAAAGWPTLTHLFPTPARLAQIDPAVLPMVGARARALVGLCAALAEGRIDLGPGTDRAATERDLLALRGIGPWTAGYIALRALGDPDRLLASDLIARRQLERYGLTDTAHLAPWRSYVTVHLWKEAIT